MRATTYKYYSENMGFKPILEFLGYMTGSSSVSILTVFVPQASRIMAHKEMQHSLETPVIKKSRDIFHLWERIMSAELD